MRETNGRMAGSGQSLTNYLQTEGLEANSNAQMNLASSRETTTARLQNEEGKTISSGKDLAAPPLQDEKQK